MHEAEFHPLRGSSRSCLQESSVSNNNEETADNFFKIDLIDRYDYLKENFYKLIQINKEHQDGSKALTFECVKMR